MAILAMCAGCFGLLVRGLPQKSVPWRAAEDSVMSRDRFLRGQVYRLYAYLPKSDDEAMGDAAACLHARSFHLLLKLHHCHLHSG